MQDQALTIKRPDEKRRWLEVVSVKKRKIYSRARSIICLNLYWRPIKTDRKKD